MKEFRSGAARALLAGALALGLAACEAPAAAPPPPASVRLVSGSPGGGFHPLGSALARAYGQVLSGIDIQLRGGSGSVGNAEALQRGDADIGFVFADVAYVAHQGALEQQRTPFDHLRGIAVLQVAALHVVVRPGLHVRDISALRRRRVAIGPAGSGTALTSQVVMRAFGIEPGDIIAETMPFDQAPRRLAEGKVDAAFVTGAFPVESMTAAIESGATLLNIDGPPVDRLRSDYPFLRLLSIPKETYPSQAEAVRTIGLENLLACRSDLPEAVVYELTRGLFEAVARMSTEPGVLRLVNLEQAPATPIPLHPGAARYYRERELGR